MNARDRSSLTDSLTQLEAIGRARLREQRLAREREEDGARIARIRTLAWRRAAGRARRAVRREAAAALLRQERERAARLQGRVDGTGAAARLLARARVELALQRYSRQQRIDSLHEQRAWRARWRARLTGSTVAALAVLALCALSAIASHGPGRDHNTVLAETLFVTEQTEQHARTALNEARADERAAEVELLGALRAALPAPELDPVGEAPREVATRARWVAPSSPAATPAPSPPTPAPKPPACAGDPYDPLNFCL